MFRYITIVSFCLLYGSIAWGQHNAENELQKAVTDNNFFHVKALLHQNSKGLPEQQYLYYTALVENKFDQPSASNQHIETLLKQFKNKISDSLKIVLLNTMASNYIRLYQYRRASDACTQILNSYSLQLDSNEKRSFQNTRDLFGSLADVPPQTFSISQNELIPAYRNKFNHLMVPVRTKDSITQFIFDSGAGLSTISESCAKKMGLRLIESSVTVGSATSIDVKSKLAVAEKLYVGNLLFRNVVFLVLPDEKLSFPQAGLVIDGIIGFPVIHQMGEVHLRKDGKILVPKTPVQRNLQNLFLDDLVPVVAIYTGADTLLMNFDTGAKTTELSEKYYKNHKAFVDSVGTKTTKHFGGAGGITEMIVYELPQFNFTIGTQKAKLLNVPVQITNTRFTKNRDGNLGQDVMTQFDEMILNFRYLYVDFAAKQ